MKRFFKRYLPVVLCAALWPALAGAAPPAPQGEIVYADDFSDPAKSGLDDNVNATDYSRGFHAPGVYHLRLLNENDTRWSLFPGKSYGRSTLEVDAWDNSDDFVGDISYGVVIRATDAQHFYALLIDPRESRYSVRKMEGGTWSDLLAWKDSTLISEDGGVNQIRVDAVDDTLTVYLNGELLDSVKDGAYAQGGFGLIAGNVDADKPHTHFDNVRIYAPAARAASLPVTGDSDLVLLLVAGMLAILMLALGTWSRRRKLRY
jgi:LPXTG-motif cell wall-anchored protein